MAVPPRRRGWSTRGPKDRARQVGSPCSRGWSLVRHGLDKEYHSSPAPAGTANKPCQSEGVKGRQDSYDCGRLYRPKTGINGRRHCPS